MFSVIIPVYNKENYVEKTIKSVLSQTWPDFELIVVDDGSIDNSFKVITSIIDYRIKVYQKKNEGVSVARNYGVEMSSKEFICFLDADDEWAPNFLEVMHDTILKYPNRRFFTSAFMSRSNTKETIYEIQIGNSDDFVIDDYCGLFIRNRQAICCVGSVCVKKSLLIEVGMFPPGVKRGEDHDLWLRLVCKDKIVYTKRTRMIYYLDTENNSRAKYNSYKESFPYWKWYEYPYKYKNSLYKFTTYFLLSNAWSSLRHGKFDSAWAMTSKIKIFGMC